MLLRSVFVVVLLVTTVICAIALFNSFNVFSPVTTLPKTSKLLLDQKNGNPADRKRGREASLPNFDPARLDELLPRTMPALRYNELMPDVRYLVYEPTGGWNNQRDCLDHALVLAARFKRVLVLPPVGRHTPGSPNQYSTLRFPEDLIAMDRLVDVPYLLQAVAASGIPGFLPLDLPLHQWLRSLWENELEKVSPGSKRAGMSSAKCLYFYKEMFHSNRAFNPRRGEVYGGVSPVRYAPAIRQLAHELAQTLGIYSSVHARRSDFAAGNRFYGDDQTEKIHGKDRPRAKVKVRKLDQIASTLWEVWAQNPARHKEGRYGKRIGTNVRADLDKTSYPDPSTRKLYVATQPNPPPRYFDSLCNSGRFECHFSDDGAGPFSMALNQFRTVLPFRNSSLPGDLFGMVEQLVCVNSLFFLGTTSGSTFSKHIRGFRAHVDISFPEALESVLAQSYRGEV